MSSSPEGQSESKTISLAWNIVRFESRVCVFLGLTEERIVHQITNHKAYAFPTFYRNGGRWAGQAEQHNIYYNNNMSRINNSI